MNDVSTVDGLVDQYDEAYEAGREDLAQKIVELLQQYDAEGIDPDIALAQLHSFIEAEIGWDGDDEDVDLDLNEAAEAEFATAYI